MAQILWGNKKDLTKGPVRSRAGYLKEIRAYRAALVVSLAGHLVWLLWGLLG